MHGGSGGEVEVEECIENWFKEKEDIKDKGM
jgi:hypothetical protein